MDFASLISSKALISPSSRLLFSLDQMVDLHSFRNRRHDSGFTRSRTIQCIRLRSFCYLRSHVTRCIRRRSSSDTNAFASPSLLSVSSKRKETGLSSIYDDPCQYALPASEDEEGFCGLSGPSRLKLEGDLPASRSENPSKQPSLLPYRTQD